MPLAFRVPADELSGCNNNHACHKWHVQLVADKSLLPAQQVRPLGLR